MENYLLGVDNGLTATKAVIYDLHGKEVGIASLSTRPVSSQAGFSELDMQQVWGNCCKVIAQVLANTLIPAKKIAAIGTSAYGNGLHLCKPGHEEIASWRELEQITR